MQASTENWFANSRLSFHKAALFIYRWAYNMTSIKFYEHELEMKANCVVDWNNYLREVCAAHILANPRVIGGPNMTVEINKSVFTKRKNCIGCQLLNSGFLESATTLLPIIEDNIRLGTTIISDEWSAYKHIINIGHFQHLTVNHSLHFVSPINGAHTQNIERLWKSTYEKSKRQNSTHRCLLDSYMCKFKWQQEIGLKVLDPCNSIPQHIVDFWPPQ
uniref:ISXO2-like transposase domain-containing protein n=1 Tax=Octopus bimaculoides TaxID=37653 RepID=A0A0L8GRY1_OCTBM